MKNNDKRVLNSTYKHDQNVIKIKSYNTYKSYGIIYGIEVL